VILDFERAVVTFKLARTVRGKEKETLAEVPGLFSEAAVAVCFGGRDQRLSLMRCTRLDSDETATVARDPFTEAMGAPVPPVAPLGDAEMQRQELLFKANEAAVAATLQ